MAALVAPVTQMRARVAAVAVSAAVMAALQIQRSVLVAPAVQVVVVEIMEEPLAVLIEGLDHPILSPISRALAVAVPNLGLLGEVAVATPRCLLEMVALVARVVLLMLQEAVVVRDPMEADRPVLMRLMPQLLEQALVVPAAWALVLH